MKDEPVIDRRSIARLEFFADCQECMDDLFRQARKKDGAQNAFKQYLETARRFSNLSVYNAMLIAIQRPGAVAVGSRRDWAKVGRQVKVGTPPLLILWPFGPVAYVFEYSDTEGEPFEGENANTLFAEGNVRHRHFDQLVDAAAAYEVVVEMDGRNGPLRAGFAHAAESKRGVILGKKSRPAWRVVLNKNLDEPSRFATLAHELGHIYCGHLGAGPNAAWPDRRHLLDTPECELEAEAVSYIVCLRNGLKPRSASYLSTHIDKANLDKVSMFSIYEAANRVESRSARAGARKGKMDIVEEAQFPID